MKIAITGKGGVGKTTLAAVLSHLFSRSGRRVIAVDADPDANLGAALGLRREEVDKIRPIAEMTDLITERTGAKPGSMGGVFRLNPKVDDIPDECGLRIENITMLVMGKSKDATAGCYCPENVFLRRLLAHLIMERDDIVIVDMEAGIEHLTRGTSSEVDAFIVVAEPGQRSIQTAMTVKRMAGNIGIKKTFLVGNKIRNENDITFIRESVHGIPFLGAVSLSDCVMEADIKGESPFYRCPETVREVESLRNTLEKLIATGNA